MTEIKTEKQEARGFAGLLKNVLMPVNDKEDFKKKFAKTRVKILVNAVNVNYAALINIDSGTVVVTSIPNKPEENLNKEVAGWDAYLGMDSSVFLRFAMKRISLVGMGKLILKGEVKVKGIRKLMYMMKLMKILTE